MIKQFSPLNLLKTSIIRQEAQFKLETITLIAYKPEPRLNGGVVNFLFPFAVLVRSWWKKDETFFMSYNPYIECRMNRIEIVIKK